MFEWWNLAKWPDSLPCPVRDETAQYEPLFDSILKSQGEYGALKRRRTVTGVPERFTFSLKLNPTQIETLLSFCDETLKGVKQFTWMDWRTGDTAYYAFEERPATNEFISNSKNMWLCPIKLIKMPHRKNLVFTPDFSGGIGDWVPYNANASIHYSNDTQDYLFTDYLRVNVDSISQSAPNPDIIESKEEPISGGQRFYRAGYLYNQAGDTTVSTAIRWRHSDQSASYVNAGILPAANNWTYVSGIVTAPDDAIGMAQFVRWVKPTNTDTAYVAVGPQECYKL